MKEELLQNLYKPFDNVRTKPGGKQYKYVASKDVIDRMNRLLKGRWSSEVVKEEIVEDNVLVHVRVYTLDDDGVGFYHDGYGSSQIARFTFGDNKGKAINIGNNYNAAKSMAIRDACKKWGVGLYIEDNPYDEGVEDLGPVEHEGFQSVVIPDNIKAATKIEQKSVEPEEKPTETVPPPFPAVETPREVEKAPFEDLPSISRELKPPTIKLVGGVPPEKEVSPVITAPNETKPASAPEITAETEIEHITDVQKVAVQGLIGLKGLKFEDLLAGALGRTDDLPKTPDELSYQDAAKVIKYGNKVGRK